MPDALAAATRRQFLRRSGLGFGTAALAALLAEDGLALPAAAAPDPLAPKKPYLPAKAKRVIYLHMAGSPPHLDMFDYKPELVKRNGQDCPQEFLKGKADPVPLWSVRAVVSASEVGA